MGRSDLDWLVVLVLTATLIALGACARETRTLTISGPVHVYPSSTPPSSYPGTNFIAELGPHDSVRVLQVKYEKGFAAVHVRLPDGREGWVFSGESIDLH